MRLTKEQEKKMDRAIRHAPFSQLFVWVWWSIFNVKKSEKLIKNIELGMTWYASYLIAKNHKNDK